MKPVFENFVSRISGESSDEGFAEASPDKQKKDIFGTPVSSLKWRSPIKFENRETSETKNFTKFLAWIIK
jgi:hypothetical protein